MNRANQVHLNDSPSIVVFYDLQYPGEAERLDREHDGWRDSAHIEQWDAQYAAMVIRPGGALGALR